VFLDSRGTHGEAELEKNAMVAGKMVRHAFHFAALIPVVLLREIEYFKGVLIMTTNRVTTFDIAMLSRINWSINFGDLTPQAELDIWTNWFSKWRRQNEALLRDLPMSMGPQAKSEFDKDKQRAEDFLDLIKSHSGKVAKLNGREIRNIFMTSRTMANGGLVKFKYISDCYWNIIRFRDEMSFIREDSGRLLAGTKSGGR
jgi:hypothetical protein